MSWLNSTLLYLPIFQANTIGVTPPDPPVAVVRPETAAERILAQEREREPSNPRYGKLDVTG
jgi:hypothetical protein